MADTDEHPSDLLYNRDHDWARVDGSVATVGITSFAQKQLGEIVFVELPNVGDRPSAEDAVATVESVKAVSEVFAPLSGEVIEINEAIADAPELVNEDPYGEGWMFKLKLSSKDELEQLLDSEAYARLLAAEGD